MVLATGFPVLLSRVSCRHASGVVCTQEKLPVELPMDKHGNTTPTRRALDGRMINGTLKRRNQVLEASFKYNKSISQAAPALFHLPLLSDPTLLGCG